MASRATQTDTGIDPQIAELLGLDFTADLDREDYISLLKEKMMAGRMSSSKLSSEETELITDEFKRVKRDTRKTFKVKKTKISADSFKKKTSSLRAGANQKSLPRTGRGGALTVRKTKVDPGALVKPGGEEQEQSILEKILASVNSILGTLREDQKNKKKIADQERRKGERSKRTGKEDKLESGIFKGLLKGVKKILKPVEGILSRILKFIGTILIGKVLIAIVDWMSDKDNEGKLNAIGRFLEDTWPALLAGFLLFGSGLTGFVTGLLASIAGFTLRLGGALIKLAAAHPIAAALILGTGAAAYSALNNEKTREEENKKDDKNIVTPTETREKGETPSGSQLRDEMIRQRGFGGMFNSGGIVPGSGPNKDTIPAMLTPGEFVMSRGAVQQYGTDTLSSMNSMGGGTNRPMIRGGVTYANGGGMTDKKQTLPPDQQKKMEERREGRGNFFTNMFGGKSKEKPNGGGGSLKNLTGQDYRDLAFIVSAEAQRGTNDEYGVAAAVLNRVADPAWPNTVKAVGSQAGQFEAVYKGLAKDDPELAAKLASAEGQAKIVKAMKMLKGRTDFKGTSQYGNMGKGDVKFSSRGNFYHYKEQIGKSDPPPTPLPSYYTKFIGTGGPAVSLASTKASGGGGSVSNSSGGGSTSTKEGGSGFSGLEMLANIVNAQNKFVSSKTTSSLGSKPSPPAPPAPPTKATPKVSVVNSSESSAQQTPISETGSYVPSIPSAPTSLDKKITLQIS